MRINCLPLPLGEGRGEGAKLSAKFFLIICCVYPGQDKQKKGFRLRPHSNPLSRGEGVNRKSAIGDLVMETVLNDIRFGVRMLTKNSAFTLVALLTLALGIGANTAIFSVVNAIVFRPLPYAAPQRLVGVWTKDLKRPGSQYPASLPTFRDWQQQAHSFDGFAAYAFNRFHISGKEGPDETRAALTTANFFEVMGVQPVLGRQLQASDDHERVVVLGDELWRRRFNAYRNVLGKTIDLDAGSFTIIGVMTPSLLFSPPALE